MIFSSTRKSQLMIFTSRVRAHAIVLFTDLSSTFISHLRQALHYDYKSFVRKQSQVSPLMQDILLCTIGIGILFTLIFIKQDTIPFYFVSVSYTHLDVYKRQVWPPALAPTHTPCPRTPSWSAGKTPARLPTSPGGETQNG